MGNPGRSYNATWVDYDNDGDESVVTNVLNRVSLTKPATLRSVNGPDATVIEGADSLDPEPMRGACAGNSSVLSGFTLRNGYGSDAGGGANCEPQGVLTNCVLAGNGASDGGGA